MYVFALLAYLCPEKPEESIGYPGARVVNSLVGARNQNLGPWKSNEWS